MDIPSPTFAAGHGNRPRESQFVLAPVFTEFVRQVQAAGWTEDEAADAMLRFANRHLLRIISDRKAQE